MRAACVLGFWGNVAVVESIRGADGLEVAVPLGRGLNSAAFALNVNVLGGRGTGTDIDVDDEDETSRVLEEPLGRCSDDELTADTDTLDDEIAGVVAAEVADED